MPHATIATALTATGDMVVGPGAPTNLTKGLPCACMGDAVAGPVVVSGLITVPFPSAMNNIMMGRPQANIGSVVAGVSVVGIPIGSVLAVSPFVTNLA